MEIMQRNRLLNYKPININVIVAYIEALGGN
jgi:hypothetical protein